MFGSPVRNFARLAVSQCSKTGFQLHDPRFGCPTRGGFPSPAFRLPLSSLRLLLSSFRFLLPG